MGSLSIDADNKSNPASVLLEPRIVEALSLRVLPALLVERHCQTFSPSSLFDNPSFTLLRSESDLSSGQCQSAFHSAHCTGERRKMSKLNIFFFFQKIRENWNSNIFFFSKQTKQTRRRRVVGNSFNSRRNDNSGLQNNNNNQAK